MLLIVMGGTKGDGFSAAIANPALISKIPVVLRSVADEIEKIQKTQMNQ